MDPLLTPDELAALLKVPPTWVRDKITARKIPFTKVGRHVRFAPHHVTQIIANGEEPVAVAPRRDELAARRAAA